MSSAFHNSGGAGSSVVDAPAGSPPGDLRDAIERLRRAMGLDAHIRCEDVVKWAADRLSGNTPTDAHEELMHALRVLWGSDDAPSVTGLSGPGWSSLFGVRLR